MDFTLQHVEMFREGTLFIAKSTRIRRSLIVLKTLSNDDERENKKDDLSALVKW